MQIYDAASSSLSISLSPSAVAIGLFDGIHRGHLALLEATRRAASERGLSATVLTFDDDPALKPSAPRILSLPDRLRGFRDAGMGAVVVLPFSAVRDMTPEAFVEGVLLRSLGARLAVVGYNFRFGRGGAATADDLTALLRAAGADAIALPAVTCRDGSPVSSSRIRAAVEAGDLPLAAELLGRPFSLTLPVLHGQALGRTIGLPTANQEIPRGALVPKRGVYATEALVFGRAYPAVTNVGTRPTVLGDRLSVETHIIGFSGDLYGDCPTIRFLAYLREERRFPSLTALRAEILQNITEAKHIWQENGRA